MKFMDVICKDDLFYVFLNKIENSEKCYLFMDEFGEFVKADENFILNSKYIGNMHETVGLVRLIKKQVFADL